MSRPRAFPFLPPIPALRGTESVVTWARLVLRGLRPVPLSPTPPPPDILAADDLPSVRFRGRRDRVLAVIDQDGFLFARDALDDALFGGRAVFLRRKRNHLEVVLEEGRVRLRKRFGVIPPAVAGWRAWLWSLLGLGFWTELEALRRLQDLPSVPRLHRVDRLRRVLVTDYVHGRNLRHRAAEAGLPVYDTDPGMAELDDHVRTGREAVLLAPRLDPALRARILDQSERILARGVALGDVHPANLIVGPSAAPCWVDFELAWFDFLPDWPAHRLAHREMVARAFPLPTVEAVP